MQIDFTESHLSEEEIAAYMAALAEREKLEKEAERIRNRKMREFRWSGGMC